MHEMALTQSVVDAVCEHAAGRRVYSVKVEVGALCAVVPDAMTFCFEMAVEGTVADGARLDIDVRPGAVRPRVAATRRARFKVPTYVEFRDALPYTQTGKVMKHQLEQELAHR